MKGKVRCAVLGLGRLGYWHAENIAFRIPEARLVSVVASRRERAVEVARQLGADGWSIDPLTVLRSPQIDAVIIATPTGTHAGLIQLAAEHGKHIFVEKPLTLRREEVGPILAALEKARVICQVGFMRRFDPAYAEAKRRIEQGDIGKPVYFKAVSRDPGSPPEAYIRTSGGLFLDMAIHDFDIARYLMGAEITSVFAHGCILKHGFMKACRDVDQAMTYVTFDSGASGDIETSRNSAYGYDIRGEVVGTEGAIQIGSLRHREVRILTNKGSSFEVVPHFPERFKKAFLLEMKHFIRCVRDSCTPLVTVNDGRIALEIALAATQSSLVNQRILIESNWQEPAEGSGRLC